MTCYHCKQEFCWLCRSKCQHSHYRWYNIFGCPDMQFSDQKPFKYPNLYRFLLLLSIILLTPIALALTVVFGFIGVVFGLPSIICFKSDCFSSVYNDFSKCQKFWTVTFLGIIGIVLSPVSLILIVLAIIGAIPFGVYYLISWICDN